MDTTGHPRSPVDQRHLRRSPARRAGRLCAGMSAAISRSAGRRPAAPGDGPPVGTDHASPGASRAVRPSKTDPSRTRATGAGATAGPGMRRAGQIRAVPGRRGRSVDLPEGRPTRPRYGPHIGQRHRPQRGGLFFPGDRQWHHGDAEAVAHQVEQAVHVVDLQGDPAVHAGGGERPVGQAGGRPSRRGSPRTTSPPSCPSRPLARAGERGGPGGRARTIGSVSVGGSARRPSGAGPAAATNARSSRPAATSSTSAARTGLPQPDLDAGMPERKRASSAGTWTPARHCSVPTASVPRIRPWTAATASRAARRWPASGWPRRAARARRR